MSTCKLLLQLGACASVCVCLFVFACKHLLSNSSIMHDDDCNMFWSKHTLAVNLYILHMETCVMALLYTLPVN